MAHIAAVYCPDLTFFFTSSAQVTEPTEADVISINEAVSIALSTKDQVLSFVLLDLEALLISVFIDASFALNRDSSSQLGFLITFMGSSSRCNIKNYSSCKSRRIARSALAAENFFLVYEFDYASTMSLAIKTMCNSQVPLYLYTESKSLYDGIVGLNQTTEKRLFINLR